MSRRVLVVAGEASGDKHAAGLVREAQALAPDLSFAGIGGRNLAGAGTEILWDAAELGVVGIAEVLGQARQLWGALSLMKRQIRQERPDALLLVDFPDFNLHLAGVAARLGIPVVYFISPQVWAWRSGRVRKIRRRVRRMVVFFPFEEAFYRAHGVPVTFAGHPFAETQPIEISPAEARVRLGIDPGSPVFGLLPGSRSSEINRHLEPLFDTARLVQRQVPEAAFLIPVAETVDSGPITTAAQRSGLPVVALPGAFDLVVAAMDAAVAASGTVTLELALRGVPPVVVYHTGRFTYAIGRLLLKIPFISLVNLIAGRQVVPELVQQDFTPERAAQELLRLGLPGAQRETVLAGIAEVKGRLGPPGAYRRAAAALLEVLDGAGPAAQNPQP